jgi:hypothetical protein
MTASSYPLREPARPLNNPAHSTSASRDRIVAEAWPAKPMSRRRRSRRSNRLRWLPADDRIAGEALVSVVGSCIRHRLGNFEVGQLAAGSAGEAVVDRVRRRLVQIVSQLRVGQAPSFSVLSHA